MKKVIWGIYTVMCWSLTLTSMTAYAESSEFNVGEGILWAAICGIITPIIGMIILVGMSRTKKKATQANNYIKEERGGKAVITAKKDDFERTITESRNSSSSSSSNTLQGAISSAVADKLVDAGEKAIKNQINKNKQ